MYRTSFNHEIKNRNNFVFQSNFFLDFCLLMKIYFLKKIPYSIRCLTLNQQDLKNY